MLKSNEARHALFGRARLAVVEVSLCILVPALALLIWLLIDQESRNALLSGLGTESPSPVNSVYDMAQFAEGSAVSIQTQGQIRIWDLKRRMVTDEIQSHLVELRCVACAPDQRLIAVGSGEGYIEIWDLDHPDHPLAATPQLPQGINVCQFSPDGRYLCTNGEKSTIAIWDALTLQPVGQLPGEGRVDPVRCLSFTSDGTCLLAGDDCGAIHVWDFATRRLLRTMQVADRTDYLSREFVLHLVEDIFVLPGDQEVIAVTRGRGISVWEINSGRCLRQFGRDVGGLQTAALSNDGNYLITGSNSGEVLTWVVSTGRRSRMERPHQDVVRAICCSPDGATVISGDCVGRIQYSGEI